MSKSKKFIGDACSFRILEAFAPYLLGWKEDRVFRHLLKSPWIKTLNYYVGFEMRWTQFVDRRGKGHFFTLEEDSRAPFEVR